MKSTRSRSLKKRVASRPSRYRSPPSPSSSSSSNESASSGGACKKTKAALPRRTQATRRLSAPPRRPLAPKRVGRRNEVVDELPNEIVPETQHIDYSDETSEDTEEEEGSQELLNAGEVDEEADEVDGEELQGAQPSSPSITIVRTPTSHHAETPLRGSSLHSNHRPSVSNLGATIPDIPYNAGGEVYGSII